jgi:16S rRNA (cytidine1402-2'-O)-methyltransferase
MGTLYIVATPIGNLEDITYRAIKILKEVGLVACEDTRHTRILLDRYQISVPTISYHQHSKLSKIDYLIGEIKSGRNIALVSDAGTPGISDPGGVLVERAIKENINVIPIPGPSAATSLLSVSGMPADSFLFLGFLPKKKGRQTIFRSISESSNLKLYKTIVFYESPYSIIKTLEDFNLSLGDKEVVIGREITKKFEEIFRGRLSEAISHYKSKKILGEFAVAIKVGNG